MKSRMRAILGGRHALTVQDCIPHLRHHDDPSELAEYSLELYRREGVHKSPISRRDWQALAHSTGQGQNVQVL